jgi:ferredoxin-NADP reductase
MTLFLSPAEGKARFSFTPGQYVTVSLPGHAHILNEKPYTISSIPNDAYVELTVKKLGTFSGALHELPIGSPLTLQGPEGDFYPEKEMEHIVFLAAGIGITPFYSIIRQERLADGISRRLTLVYTVRTRSQGVFVSELADIAHVWPQFSLILHESGTKGRMTAEMIGAAVPISPSMHFFICGPNEFVVHMWKGLLRRNIPEDHIFLESFY